MRLIEQIDKIQTMLAQSSVTELEYDAISLELKKIKRYYEIKKTEVGPEEISFVVRSYYDLPKNFHVIKSRKREFVKARQICAKILIENTNLTLVEIGNYFDKDHATMLHGKKTISDLIDVSREIRTEYGEIIKIINEKYGQLNNIKP